MGVISRKTDPNYAFHNALEKVNFISTEVLLKQIPFKPDFIIVGWVSGFINTRSIYELNKATGAPVLWYLLDMSPLTGGCHYAWGCNGYTKTCGTCPALHSARKKDISHRNFMEKLRHIQKTDLTVVPASSWLTKQAHQSALFAGKTVEQIMLGIDIGIFKPSDRFIGRTVFDLPVDKKIVFFGAPVIGQERKGGKYMIDALKILSTSLPDDIKEEVFLLIAGRDDGSFLKDISLPHKFVGFLNDDRILALAYQASDVFVCPSIEDAGPMMINEAILCGTPVVAFEMGVAPDLVHAGKTGYRARLRDSQDLAKGIMQILHLSEDEYRAMSRNCRELGLQLCSPKAQVDSFEELFKTIGHKSRP